MSTRQEVMRGADGRFLAARICDLTCYYYVNQESEANFRAFQEWADTLPSKYPRGTGTIVWVDAVAALHPPPESVRKRYGALATRNAVRQFARVSIVQATGFGGATIRAVLTSLNRFQRLPIPQHVTEDPRQGIRWLLTHMPADPNRCSVEDAYQFFQATLDEYRRLHSG